MGVRKVCFLENSHFSTKYGHTSNYFLWKIEKKEIFLNVVPIIWRSFDRIDVFFTKYMHDSGGVFHEKCGKNYIRAQFLRECTFVWQNMGMRVLCFLENGRFLRYNPWRPKMDHRRPKIYFQRPGLNSNL